MTNDLRHALRSLRRAPVFTSVAVLTLSLAIGSAAAVFSVVDAVFVRGLPYPQADRLQTIYERSENGGLRVPSFPTFTDWQAQATLMRDAIDGMAFVRGDGVLVPGPDGPQRQIAAYVTPGFFGLMGMRPIAGRTFAPDDEAAGAPRVAVISYDFFMNHFGGDRSAIGATVSVDSVPTKVIGIMPRGFAYPNFAGSGGWLPPVLWQPVAVFQATHAALSKRSLHVDSRAIVRLANRADSARVTNAMKALQQHLAQQFPVEQAHWTSVGLQGISDELFGPLSATLALIAGAVALMLALACANVANLLLVRASIGSRDLAVRAAIGASRWRLARRQLAEVAVIAVAAGALGMWMASMVVAGLRPYAAQRMAFAGDIHVDARAAAFVLALVVVVALAVAMLPVIQMPHGNLVERLRGGPSTRAHGAAERRTRDALAVVQLGLAIAVLIGAGLLIQSLRRVSNVALGYDPDVMSFAISPPAHRYTEPAEAAALYKRIMDASAGLASVQGVAATGGALIPTKVETDADHGAAQPEALYHPVSAAYFAVMRIPIVAGRGFTDEDLRAPSGFVITENVAHKLWPGGSAIGQRITVRRQSQARADVGQPITMPIIGVVGDHRIAGPEADPSMQVFLPYTLEVWPWMTFAVRAPRTAAMAAQLERAVHDVEPALTFLGKPTAAREGLATLLTQPRVFVMALMTAFGAIALFIAAIGLYGIIEYGVTQRTHEMGIRIAVGATARDVVSLVMRQAMGIVAVGVALGLGAGLAGSKLVRSMLFATSANDPTTFIVVPCVLALVAAGASFWPARRAGNVEPIRAIRGD
jgi:putative ABC transport system permease protein